MRKLGLDLGSKTCGFAISDLNSIISFPLETLNFNQWHFIEVIKKIKFFLYESQYKNEIDAIILGYPLKLDLTKSDRTIMVEAFKRRLEKEIDIKVIFQDERESTIRAQNILFEGGLNFKQTKQKKDTLAAQVILEDYLKGVNK